uniref:Longitudinals lacking protein, isoforms A/B/D/L n=1 Tax=Melanaphis sacchari TaxID=742174 RepID=A0A2H8TSA1_9HEMI
MCQLNCLISIYNVNNHKKLRKSCFILNVSVFLIYVLEQPEFSDVTHTGNFENSRNLCPNGCGHHYKRKGHMTYHFKFECGVHPQFKCPYCNKLSNRKSNLKTHVLCVHKVLSDDNFLMFSKN